MSQGVADVAWIERSVLGHIGHLMNDHIRFGTTCADGIDQCFQRTIDVFVPFDQSV